MPELTDDQLDGLFRKSVEEFDTPFDPAAWQDMKSRLDANDRTTPSGASIWKNLLRWGLPVALLLLLTGGGWFVYYKAKPESKTSSPQKIATSRSELTNTAKGVPMSEIPRLVDTAQTDTKPGSSLEQQAREIEQLADRGETAVESGGNKNKVDEPGSALKNRALSDESKPEKSIGENSSLDKPLRNSKVSVATKLVTSTYRLTSGTTKRVEKPANRLHTSSTLKNREGAMPGRKQRTVSRRIASFSEAGYMLRSTPSFMKRPRVNGQNAQAVEVSTIGSNGVVPEVDEVISVALPTINELASRPARWPKSLAFTGRPVESHPDTVAQRVTPKLPPMRGLSVRFVVSPDLSTVGLKNFDRPGTNIGLLLEYRIAARWSIQAGAIKSTKVYKTSTENYAWPDYIKKWPLLPISADGTCNMLDIPVNLRYDVLVKPRLDGGLPSRWFVTGGVTSYYISKEAYSFSYEDPTSPHIYPNMKAIAPASTGGFGFSNLNLSLGYERSFSRRLSWQIEPFIKVPLRGVGYFKTNLLSTGAFFSLRYKL